MDLRIILHISLKITDNQYFLFNFYFKKELELKENILKDPNLIFFRKLLEIYLAFYKNILYLKKIKIKKINNIHYHFDCPIINKQ